MKIILEVPEGKHFKFWMNSGNWQKIIGCEDCNSYHAKADIDIFKPCCNCGGVLSGIKEHTAKWQNGKWAIRRGVYSPNSIQM